MDAVLTTTGKTFTDYFDNIVGSVADDGLKKFIRSWLEGNPVPGFVIYDGVYSGPWTFQGGSMPTTITVKDGKLTGGAKYSASYPGVTVRATISLTGTVDEKGVVAGTVSSTASIGGQIGGSASGGGTIKGQIVDNVATLNYTLSGSTTINAMGGYGGGVFGGSANGTLTLKK